MKAKKDFKKNIKTLKTLPSKAKEQSKTLVPTKLINKGKKQLAKLDTPEVKRDVKVTGFLTMFFTGIGVIAYCVKKHK